MWTILRRWFRVVLLGLLWIRDGGRSPATAEAVSVSVGHGQNGSSGVRRRSRALSPPTYSEDSFDSQHAQHHQKDVRIASRRQEEMTELAGSGRASFQQGNRPVSRELLPPPLPFPENEHVESEHLRSLSRAGRSRVVRRLGCQGWANDQQDVGLGGRKRVVFASTRLFVSICSAYQEVSAAECMSAAEAFKALCGSVPGNTDRGVKQATFKEGLVSLPDPSSKMADGADLLTGSDFEAWRDWNWVLLRSPSELQEAITLEGRVAPHTDPELKRKPRFYARLISDMRLRGLVSFWPPSEATVGVFVVPEKQGKQKVIF